MSSIIVFGLTSSLGAVLLPYLEYHYSITTFVRTLDNESSEKKKWKETLLNELHINTIIYDHTKENDLYQKFKTIADKADMVLYLSSVGDLKVLEICREKDLPNLVIGSGAFTDWLAGRIDITKVPSSFGEYVQGKARETFLAFTMIHPGFYLSPKDSKYVGSGLHVDTLKFLFAEDFDETKSWGKDKFVTPMNLLCELIVKWCKNPSRYQGFQGPFGTSSSYPRQELRGLADLDVPEKVKSKYPFRQDNKYKREMKRTRDMFDMEPITEKVLKRACVESKEWASKL